MAESDSGRKPWNPTRRTLLELGAGALVLSAVPAQAAQQIKQKDLDVFLSVSRTLTGQSQLSETIARRTYLALREQTRGFPATLKRLAAGIDGAPAGWGRREQALARDIVKAWYLGVAGEGPKAEVLAYEHAQMYRSVAPELGPRTYCASAPGGWAQLPTGTETL